MGIACGRLVDKINFDGSMPEYLMLQYLDMLNDQYTLSMDDLNVENGYVVKIIDTRADIMYELFMSNMWRNYLDKGCIWYTDTLIHRIFDHNHDFNGLYYEIAWNIEAEINSSMLQSIARYMRKKLALFMTITYCKNKICKGSKCKNHTIIRIKLYNISSIPIIAQHIKDDMYKYLGFEKDAYLAKYNQGTTIFKTDTKILTKYKFKTQGHIISLSFIFSMMYQYIE